eukprot:TRINITY_DN22012_c0_g1_i1.p1 TRINITY_DN22012_c0_g1~~TRINITY_DN22012_c0_g1_i1.p1  ORF type:complete len:442 (-),score=39.69 TRINITY_DN22012_c0_g1_i1:780-2105(-)
MHLSTAVCVRLPSQAYNGTSSFLSSSSPGASALPASSPFARSLSIFILSAASSSCYCSPQVLHFSFTSSELAKNSAISSAVKPLSSRFYSFTSSSCNLHFLRELGLPRLLKLTNSLRPSHQVGRAGSWRLSANEMPPPLAVLLREGGRVLSIQSHTVQGYVGNKSAVFPLQLLGFDVDPINSVQFSNHTGYPTFKGDVLNGEQLWALIEGLEANDLLHYTHLLTGYIGSLSFLDTVLRVIEKLRAVNPNLIYVCDPVMGDNGKLYIKPELVPVYREKIMPLASVLTPNAFEAEQLTGLSIQSAEGVMKAFDLLHNAGPAKVVITSMELDGELAIFGSERKEGCQDHQFVIKVPKLASYFTGTGDLTTALLLGWTYKYPDDLARATELTVATLQSVLARTLGDWSRTRVTPSVKQLELRLVQSREDIMNPIIVYHARPLVKE